MSQLAREIGMTREGLSKTLSEDGNPSFTTISPCVGMRLRVAS